MREDEDASEGRGTGSSGDGASGSKLWSERKVWNSPVVRTRSVSGREVTGSMNCVRDDSSFRS
jgi:hypothetical protein